MRHAYIYYFDYDMAAERVLPCLTNLKYNTHITTLLFFGPHLNQTHVIFFVLNSPTPTTITTTFEKGLKYPSRNGNPETIPNLAKTYDKLLSFAFQLAACKKRLRVGLMCIKDP